MKFYRNSVRRLLRSLSTPILLSIFLVTGIVTAQEAPGLYAVFQTNQGEFTCQLYYQRAPRTVANFVRLAEGTQPWLDFARARISRERYYDQTIFHRIIKGFVIQGGSPNGQGNDGPGYQFRDELHPELVHDRPGILSMAKLSPPHTNGSQFFVTLAPTPWLDNVHSVFGEVIAGLDVIYQIALVETDEGDHPVHPQIIESLRIIRQGPEATAFTETEPEPPLPALNPISIDIQRNADELNIVWPARENHEYHALFSPDLSTWSSQRLSATGIASLQPFLNAVPHQYFLFIETEVDLPATTP